MHTLHILFTGVVTLSERTNRAVTYLTDEEQRQLEEWSNEVDKSVSHLLREAVLEYLDRDRGDRIEDTVRENSEKLDEVLRVLSDGDEHTHTSEDRVTKASETVEKTREIADTLNNRHASGARASQVERAIKDIAGGDPRTIEKYKRELRERGHVYEHPNSHSNVWFLDREPWLAQVEQYAKSTPDPRGTAKDILSDYPVNTHEVLKQEVLVDE